MKKAGQVTFWQLVVDSNNNNNHSKIIRKSKENSKIQKQTPNSGEAFFFLGAAKRLNNDRMKRWDDEWSIEPVSYDVPISYMVWWVVHKIRNTVLN